MILIKKPHFKKMDKGSRVCADIEVGGAVYPLWLEVDESYEKYLCWERSDAFVLAMMQFALRKGESIQCEGEMTDRLYEQLTEQFLPAFNKINGTSLKITAPVAPEVEHPEGGDRIGTGISCGVDSLHVFASHSDITTACLWSAGIGSVTKSSEEMMQGRFPIMMERSRGFAVEMEKEFLVARTNFDSHSVPGLKWTGMTTNGNLFCIFALQKLWKRYYIASDCDIFDFKFRIDGVGADPARYEYFLFPFCSLGNIQIRMDGAECNRVEKVRDLVDFLPARKYLNVCWGDGAGVENCSYRCTKCMRTLMELDVFGAVDKFAEVFDVEYYHKHRAEFLAEYYRGVIQKDNFLLELVPYYHNVNFSFAEKARAWTIVLSKAIKKMLRFGRVNTNYKKFSSKG